MNLYFRFFYQILRSFFSAKIKVTQSDRVAMRVLPLDLDGNFHMNNGVFLSVMDLGRTRFSIRSGLFKKALKEKWGFGVVGGLNITYLKSLTLFQKYELVTKLSGHYGGWTYLEQRFESKGKLVAVALVKVVFLRGKQKVSIEEIKKVMGISEIGDNKPYLEHLFNSEKELLQYIKGDYSPSEPSSRTSQV